MEKKGILRQGLDMFKELTQPYDDNIEEIKQEPQNFQDFREPAQQPVRDNSFSSFGGGMGFSSSGGSFSSSGGGYSAYPTEGSALPKPEKEKVINLHSASVQPQVVMVKPEQYNELRDIADHILSKRIVSLNLERTDKETTRRLLDFLNGVVYAVDGDIKKASAASYIIVPSGVNFVDNMLDGLEDTNYTF